jgi:energy-coupling factor transporter ATP-binding protein EcfA2
MATIDDVIGWAGSLPSWQADAVRRLLQAGDQPLTTQDYSEVLGLAKADLNLAPPPEQVKACQPAPGQFSGVPAKTASVKLLAIENVDHVNIIKSGQTQPFAESGITVVYGNNGSGKSGYSRILKLACQARDKDEVILSNVFATAPTGTPTATLKIKENASAKDITWTQGVPPDPILTNITVFDSRCARVITDDRNEITFLPYGAEAFPKLAAVVLRVKADLEAEIMDIMPVQDSAVEPGTPSAIFLESLSETTKEAAIQAATTWTPQDQLELSAHEELARTAVSTKATQEIARLEKVKGRIKSLASATSDLVAACSNFTNEAVSQTLAELNSAQLAHTTALAEQMTPESLPGVASSNQWEILYRAAKQYSEEIAYPGDSFAIGEGALCVLCQQPLSPDAVARFARFKNYIEDATSSVLDAKRKALRSIRQSLDFLLPLSGFALEANCDDLAKLDIGTADAFRTFHEGIAARKAAALGLLIEGETANKATLLPPWPASPETVLQTLAQTVTQQVVEITEAAKPEEYKKLIAKVAELKARKALSARKADISAFVTKARHNANLGRAAATLKTKEITRQGTTVVRKNLTPALVAAFNAELLTLGASRVPISVKPSGAAGEGTMHEFLLQGANSQGSLRMSQVLSEGEARVIAIAGFLAELKLAPHANAIVLDDPVSSLDHVFTGKIASRLAREGLIRQVIIFTHNIAFLMELTDACEALAKEGSPVPITVNTLSRNAKSAGITTGGVPWHCMKIKQRVQYLEERVHKINPLYRENMVEYNEKASHVYGLLREAWEASVEEDLFYSVVCRYRNSVQTMKLDEVDIEDIDARQVDLHMSKTSTWMTGHDKSKALHNDRPAPDEILGDIQALRVFSKAVIDRRKVTEKRRKDKS